MVKHSKNGEAVAEAVPAFMSLSDVARLLNKNPSTIGRWVKDGLLTAVRLPSGMPAVKRAELERFIGGSALADKTKG